MPAEPFKFDGTLDVFKKDQVLRYGGVSILDIGCNDGQLVNYLHSMGKISAGVDYDEDLINKAVDNFPDLNFQKSSMESLPFSDNSFETCVAWNILEHVDDEKMAIKEILRVASKNIILAVPREDEISIPSGVTYRHYIDLSHKRYYTRERLNQLFGDKISYIEVVSQCKPLLAYYHIGIPRIVCQALDRVLWAVARNKDPFFSMFLVIVNK